MAWRLRCGEEQQALNACGAAALLITAPTWARRVRSQAILA